MSGLKIVDEIKVAMVLDVKNLNSPMPLLHTKKGINKLTLGEILQINGTDSRSRIDFKKWCERSGNKYLGEKDMHNYIIFYIKKG